MLLNDLLKDAKRVDHKSGLKDTSSIIALCFQIHTHYIGIILQSRPQFIATIDELCIHCM